MALITLAVACIAGVYLASLTAFPRPGLLLLLAASALLALLLRGRGLSLLPAFALALLSLGALRAGVASEAGMPPPIDWYNGSGGVSVEGVVSADPEQRASGWHFPLSVERVRVDGGWQDSRGDLLVIANPPPSLIETRQQPYLRYGDRLIVVGSPAEPPVFQDFDYRDYLARQGIYSTIVYPGVALVGEGEGNVALKAIYSLRYRLSRSLSQALAEPQNAMAQALLLGRRSAMPPELTQAFRDTGRRSGSPCPPSGHIRPPRESASCISLPSPSGDLSRWLIGARRQLYILVPLISIWAYAGLAGMSVCPLGTEGRHHGKRICIVVGLYLGRQNSVMPALAAAA